MESERLDQIPCGRSLHNSRLSDESLESLKKIEGPVRTSSLSFKAPKTKAKAKNRLIAPIDIQPTSSGSSYSSPFSYFTESAPIKYVTSFIYSPNPPDIPSQSIIQPHLLDKDYSDFGDGEADDKHSLHEPGPMVPLEQRLEKLKEKRKQHEMEVQSMKPAPTTSTPMALCKTTAHSFMVTKGSKVSCEEPTILEKSNEDLMRSKKFAPTPTEPIFARKAKPPPSIKAPRSKSLRADREPAYNGQLYDHSQDRHTNYNYSNYSSSVGRNWSNNNRNSPSPPRAKKYRKTRSVSARRRAEQAIESAPINVMDTTDNKGDAPKKNVSRRANSSLANRKPTKANLPTIASAAACSAIGVAVGNKLNSKDLKSNSLDITSPYEDNLIFPPMPDQPYVVYDDKRPHRNGKTDLLVDKKSDLITSLKEDDSIYPPMPAEPMIVYDDRMSQRTYYTRDTRTQMKKESIKSREVADDYNDYFIRCTEHGEFP